MEILKCFFTSVFPHYTNIHPIDIFSGTASNAIANDIEMSFVCDSKDATAVSKDIENVIDSLHKIYVEEKSIRNSINIGEVDGSEVLCGVASIESIKTLFEHIQQGVIEMSTTYKGMAHKSNNIGLVKLNKGEFTLQVMHRSYDNDYLKSLPNLYETLAHKADVLCSEESLSPAWETSKDLPFVQMVALHYGEAYKEGPIHITATEGGIEPAVFFAKRHEMQMVSLRPTVTNAHSCHETLYINTIKPIIKTIVKTMQGIKTM